MIKLLNFLLFIILFNQIQNAPIFSLGKEPDFIEGNPHENVIFKIT
jgi:hypothetical protein